ncbi:hypothetical protein GCM10009682_45540 [Luedemannella flava]|uniref:Uncharacterized protein n=1 Tax=Luedemannella flava TaxID=349316 RepID=A0ABN2MDN4_9ACTN
MTDTEALHRRYGRLLWAYPAWHRRELGPGLLTTMLDAAAPGQGRPTGADVVDLVLGGLRCRLGLPRGPKARSRCCRCCPRSGCPGCCSIPSRSAWSPRSCPAA